MKRDLRHLLAEIGKKVKQEPHQVIHDFDHLSLVLSKHHVHLSSVSLKKLWSAVSGKHKFSEDTLDRLALFAGFQDWKDLKDAFHGDADGQINYEDGEGRQHHA